MARRGVVMPPMNKAMPTTPSLPIIASSAEVPSMVV